MPETEAENVVEQETAQEVTEEKQDETTPEQQPNEAEVAAARIAELEAALAEAKDEAARARADFYNFRTRVERDREKDRVLAAEKACLALLPVMDNLDRTAAAMDDAESPMAKGVLMVQNQFFQALMGLGLSPVDTSGKFDPKVHEAMGTVDVEDEALDGEIVDVLNKGYKLGDRLIRASLVRIGKKVEK